MGGFGAGGLGGISGSNLATGVVVPHQAGNSYMMVARFPVQQPEAPQLQQQVRAVLERSSVVSNPRGIDVLVTGRTVVLHGVVASEEEAHRIVNVISLTPGVREVRNLLTYPVRHVRDR
jgi:hypothetical protein